MQGKVGDRMADEYIRREDALEAFTFQTAYTAHEIERTINRLHAADVAPVVRWTSVKDSLPNDSGHYLAISRLNVAHGGCLDDTGGDIKKNMVVAYFDCTGKFNYPNIEYWMPLPETSNIELRKEQVTETTG